MHPNYFCYSLCHEIDRKTQTQIVHYSCNKLYDCRIFLVGCQSGELQQN
jgi:hypothetical protein